jgi:hypothetical protein
MKIAKSQLELVILEEAEFLIVESFLDKVKEKLPSREDVADFFDQLGRTFKKINKGREILVKLSNEEGITEEENELLMTAIRDMAKIIPMAGLIAMPGSPITIPFVVKLAKKYNIDIFPSEFSSEDDEIENKPRHADYEMDGNLAKGSFKLTEAKMRQFVQSEIKEVLKELNDPYGDYQRGQQLARTARDVAATTRVVGEVGAEGAGLYMKYREMIQKTPLKAIGLLLKKLIKRPIVALKLISFFRGSQEDGKEVAKRIQDYFEERERGMENFMQKMDDYADNKLSKREARKMKHYIDDNLEEAIKIVVDYYNEETRSDVKFESIIRRG